MVIRSVTRTVPGTATIPTSLRPRSTEHDVLGPLLGVGQQVGGQRPVLGLVLAAPPGAGQRADGDLALVDPHQDLRRRADQVEVVEGQKEEERAGVDHPKGAVDVERRGGGLDLEPLAGDDLEDVAGLDIILAVADDLLELVAAKVRPRLQARRAVGPDVDRRQRRAGLGELGDQIIHPHGTRRACACAWSPWVGAITTTRTVLRMWSKITTRS